MAWLYSESVRFSRFTTLRRVKAPNLILPARVQRPPRVTLLEIGVFVPLEALFPDLEATEATMAALLSLLSRDAVLLA